MVKKDRICTVVILLQHECKHREKEMLFFRYNQKLNLEENTYTFSIGMKCIQTSALAQPYLICARELHSAIIYEPGYCRDVGKK